MRILPLIAGLWLLGCGTGWTADAIPATAYFPVLPFDAAADAPTQLVPVAANHALDGNHPGITRAIIVIHDDSRDANGALATLSALAGDANHAAMILAPQFLLPSDLANFAAHLPDKGRAFATWDMAGWSRGDDSTATPMHKSLSSFTVVDLLLMYLSDRKNFPDLKSVTVAGFGAGANFTQRYAAFAIAADPLSRQNIDLRFAVADASSYLYLTATRPLGGRKGFGRPDAATCPDYNAYPYGLDKLNAYAKRSGPNQAKTDYATRFVTYLNASALDANPDGNCAAALQGADSAIRVRNFQNYMQSLFGDVAARTQVFFTAADAKTTAAGLFGSSCGMAVLFGDGICSNAFGAHNQ